MGQCCTSEEAPTVPSPRRRVFTPRQEFKLEKYFLTAKKLQIVRQRASKPLYKLLSPPFSTFSSFTAKVYITGLAGLTVENLQQHKILHLINVAAKIEAPNKLLTASTGRLYTKFQFEESYFFQFGDQLDRVVDLIHKISLGNVVVFCTSGMSRSATVLLAYAVKHLNMSLKEAFDKLQQVRPFARPNISFWFSLVRLEAEIRQDNTVWMAKVKTALKKGNNKKKPRNDQELTITVPDIYKKPEYMEIFHLEVEEARRGNCPMADTFKSAKWAAATATASRKVSSTSRNQASIAKQNTKDINKAASTQQIPNSELKPFVDQSTGYDELLEELDKLKERFPRSP